MARPVTTSAAEAYAIGICVVDRQRHGKMFVPGTFDANTKRLHPGKCRFCAKPTEELLARLAEYGIRMGALGVILGDYAAEREAEWKALSPAARMHRLREAQEPQWYEEVPL